MYVGKSGETFDDAELQPLSDPANETAEAEIKVNHLPAKADTKAASVFTFGKLNLFKLAESSEDDINNEIENSDVIEIEVPVIGSDFGRTRKYYDRDEDNKLEVKADVDGSTGFAEIGIFTTRSAFDISQTETIRDNVVGFYDDFQTSPRDETTLKNTVEATTRTYDAETPQIDTTAAPNREYHFADIQSVESKLMEQWKAADSLMDDLGEIEISTIKARRRPKYPFNVKIVVNNDEEKKSCKSKSSCTQVSFSRASNRDIDLQFYTDYSDEDLYFKTIDDPYNERPNELRSRNARRAADDFLTPAPRGLPQFRPLKKPEFIERLENESSIERSERINKNLDGLMKFVSVWAQVDKFLSDRARGAIKKIAYLTGDDYGDYSLGSRKRTDGKRSLVDDDPFT